LSLECEHLNNIVSYLSQRPEPELNMADYSLLGPAEEGTQRAYAAIVATKR